MKSMKLAWPIRGSVSVVVVLLAAAACRHACLQTGNEHAEDRKNPFCFS